MIDPVRITNYYLEENQLQEVLLFWVAAAGKNAITSAKALNSFLKDNRIDKLFYPFNVIIRIGKDKLPQELKRHGIGCYNNKAKTMWEIANSLLDLRTCSVEDLEKIYGIGFKTSRCFIMHSRRNASCAGLDRHILKWLKKKKVRKVPDSTPTNPKEYKRLERSFLRYAKKLHKTSAELDLEIWREYSGNKI